ncbi:ribonuclease T2-like isoform X1 [Astyanax mexicanus]|uniref:Ribonuclease T2, like n=2 Tax=Astyanax mexicanus TaxID=7994 RepID=A0A3B1J663_ASTMX|nr:ribonuclease T2-like isoform X1 [Astyanax mexicanus]XP_049323258.1 ribonuclease T2-like isoform X1 [Astyanax mexicanus]
MVYCKSSFFWICFTAVLAGWVLTQCPESHWTTSSETSSNHSCNWTCMIFTIQWPGSFCLSLENRNICRIPENIHNWTIHGLWPIRTYGCCFCWPVFQSHLQDLEPELSQLWPSLIKSKSNFSFWKDEWFKHGTCAACVESMGSPAHYFRTSLKLRTLFDVDNALANTGIKPSCNISYKHEEIHAALGPFLGNNYVVQCVKDEKEREVWVQLKIYISKNITLGCQKEETLKFSRASNTSLGHPCPKNTTIFYFPLDREHPKQPCP